MPLDIDCIPDRLVEAARAGHLVPFIGAGVSRQAKTREKNAFPTWTELIQYLKRYAEKKGDITEEESVEMDKLLSQGKHLMVAQALKHEMGDAFFEVVRNRCAPRDAEPAAIHRRIFDLKCPLIVTTNYDCLLEDGCQEQRGRRAHAVTFKHAAAVQHCLRGESQTSGRTLVFKIHGSVEHDFGDLVLAESDYRNLLYREPGYRTILSAVFVTRVVLMMGFSFADPELTVLTESIRESLKHRSYPDYLVLPKGEKGPVEKKRLLDDFGLEVIEYQATPGHPELLQLVDYLVEAMQDGPAGGKPAVRSQFESGAAR